MRRPRTLTLLAQRKCDLKPFYEKLGHPPVEHAFSPVMTPFWAASVRLAILSITNFPSKAGSTPASFTPERNFRPVPDVSFKAEGWPGS